MIVTSPDITRQGMTVITLVDTDTGLTLVWHWTDSGEMELSSGDQAQQLVQSTHLAQYGDDQRPETWLEESLSFIFQHVKSVTANL